MKIIRIYTLCMAILFGGYLWCAWMGYRVLGDDNEAGRSGRRVGGHYFYHK